MNLNQYIDKVGAYTFAKMLGATTASVTGWRKKTHAPSLAMAYKINLITGIDYNTIYKDFARKEFNKQRKSR
jgi:hypothetical protein